MSVLVSLRKYISTANKVKTCHVIDVTHPSPTSIKGTPSIAAVVASTDSDFVHFPASLRPQKNRNINKDSEEVGKYQAHGIQALLTVFFQMVQELTDMMKNRLVLYERRNKILPARVIVFRDGVSDVRASTLDSYMY